MRAIRMYFRPALLLLLACLVGIPTSGRAQDEQRRTKVPLIGKINGGSNRQAFSGRIQSVDPKRKLLILDAVEGSYTEYFQVKGDFEASAPGGKKPRVKDLPVGTNVIVYYEVKSDRREVTDILVLGTQSPAKEPDTKAPEPKKQGL